MPYIPSPPSSENGSSSPTAPDISRGGPPRIYVTSGAAAVMSGGLGPLQAPTVGTEGDQPRESADQATPSIPYTVLAWRWLEANGIIAAARNLADRHLGTDSDSVVPNVHSATSDDQANSDGPEQRRRDQGYDPDIEDQVQERGPNGESTTSTDPYAVHLLLEPSEAMGEDEQESRAASRPLSAEEILLRHPLRRHARQQRQARRSRR